MNILNIFRTRRDSLNQVTSLMRKIKCSLKSNNGMSEEEVAEFITKKRREERRLVSKQKKISKDL